MSTYNFLPIFGLSISDFKVATFLFPHAEVHYCYWFTWYQSWHSQWVAGEVCVVLFQYLSTEEPRLHRCQLFVIGLPSDSYCKFACYYIDMALLFVPVPTPSHGPDQRSPDVWQRPAKRIMSHNFSLSHYQVQVLGTFPRLYPLPCFKTWHNRWSPSTYAQHQHSLHNKHNLYWYTFNRD